MWLFSGQTHLPVLLNVFSENDQCHHLVSAACPCSPSHSSHHTTSKPEIILSVTSFVRFVRPSRLLAAVPPSPFVPRFHHFDSGVGLTPVKPRRTNLKIIWVKWAILIRPSICYFGFASGGCGTAVGRLWRALAWFRERFGVSQRQAEQRRRQRLHRLMLTAAFNQFN